MLVVKSIKAPARRLDPQATLSAVGAVVNLLTSGLGGGVASLSMLGEGIGRLLGQKGPRGSPQLDYDRCVRGS
jgi:hypothetical protein